MDNVLSAQQVQDMLGVDDYVVIAHGYTFERNTLDIWFEKGCIIRSETRLGSTINETGEEFFNADFFFTNVKRWYADRFNTKLLTLIRTFSQYEPPLVRAERA